MPRSYVVLSGSKDAYMAASLMTLLASYALGVYIGMIGDNCGSAH